MLFGKYRGAGDYVSSSGKKAVSNAILANAWGAVLGK